jgi:hypothetical protein
MEACAHGTPAPSVLTKEVDVVVAGPFLLAEPDFFHKTGSRHTVKQDGV